MILPSLSYRRRTNAEFYENGKKHGGEEEEKEEEENRNTIGIRLPCKLL